MEDPQRTSKWSPVNALWKRSFSCLALMFVLYPTLSHQELSAHPRRFPSNPKATGKIHKSVATLPHGVSAPVSAPLQMAALTNGNATLDSLNERLVRLDDSLTSVMQSILTVQRTVFNLEQLQELLVLLLEDILKQTGSVDKIPRTDTNPTVGDGNSGGTSLVTDSDEKDSADDPSAEVDEGAEDEKVVPNPDDTTGVVNVNGRGNEPTVRNSLALGPFGARNEQFGMSALSQNSNGFPARQSPDPNTAVGREDSAGDSSEGGRSSSNEDNSGGFMQVLQRSTQPANTPNPNSRRPQWSEPIMAHGVSDSRSRFFDVVNRMVSQLGQSGARRSHRLLGLTLGDSVSHQKESESIFEHPRMYAPLEIVPAHDSSQSNEKKHIPRTFPSKVRLFPESVISHGGPLTGPEHHSSLYLEHPEHHTGAETTGETSTGMINNLVQSSANEVTGNNSDVNTSEVDHVGQSTSEVDHVGQSTSEVDHVGQSTSEVDHVGQRTIGIPVTDVRRKREASNNLVLDKNANVEAANPEFLIDFRHNGTQQNNNSLFVTDGTTSRNGESSTSSFNFTTNKTNIHSQHTVPKDNIVSANSNHGLLQEQVKRSGLGGHEYNDDIARLLTDLSTQLHTMHTDSDVSSDDAYSHALHELDKLIWVSTDSVSNSPDTFDATNTSALDQEIESTDDVKRMTASGENILHTFPVETTNLHREFSGKRKHRNESNSLTTREAKGITNARKDSTSSHAYAMSLHDRDTLISEQERIHLNGQEISPKANMTARSYLENVTTNTYEEFDWLYQLLGHSELPPAHVTSLVEILNSLSRNDSFVDELKELNNRGRSMLIRTGDTGKSEHIINPNTGSGMVNNVTATDNDAINDDSTLTSTLEHSSSSEEDVEDADEEEAELRKTDLVNNHKMSGNDGSPENVHHKDNVNFNHDEDVSDDHEEDRSKENQENDDESDDVNSSDADEVSQNVPKKRQAHENTDVWLLKSASLLELLPQIKTQISWLSASQAGSGHPDANVNNIENKFIYRKPRATGNKLRDTNEAIKTQIQRKQILNVISRQKRQVLQSKQQPHSNPSSRHNQHKTLWQAQLPSDNTGVTTSHSSFSRSLVQSTNNAEVSSQNASQSSSNVEVQKDTTPQQMDVKYASSSSQNPDTHHTNAQDYGQSASNPHLFDPHVNGHSQTYIMPDYESVGGTSSPEEREEHSALDLEEVLTSLFLTYWQRFYHLYTRESPLTTTPTDLDIEEEVTETTLTTAASPVVTNVTTDNSTYQTSAPSMETGVDKEVSKTTPEHAVGG